MENKMEATIFHILSWKGLKRVCSLVTNHLGLGSGVRLSLRSL